MFEQKSFFDARFDWVIRYDQIWEEPECDVISDNTTICEGFLDILKSMENKSSLRPLGEVIVGPAGAGKSHLLARLRKLTIDKNFGFIANDMTAVNSFWDTLLLAFLDSIDRPTQTGSTQLQLTLEYLVATTFPDISSVKSKEAVRKMSDKGEDFTFKKIGQIQSNLARLDKPKAMRHGNVLKALIMYNSNNMMLSEVGYTYLQSIPITDEIKDRYHFTRTGEEPMAIITGLSWLMSLRSPLIICLDQFDAIVSEHAALVLNNAVESQEAVKSQQIINEISTGIAALVNTVASRTLVVLSCIEPTWDILCQQLGSSSDRYRQPHFLKPFATSNQSSALVEGRLRKVYQKSNFTPPYPTYPFTPSAIKELEYTYPRDILKNLEKHRRTCQIQGKVIEVRSFKEIDTRTQAPDDKSLKKIDSLFEELLQEPAIDQFKGKSGEENFTKLLVNGSQILMEELTPSQSIDPIVEGSTYKEKDYAFLHSRIRLIDRHQGDREQQFSFRVLEHTHFASFTARLKAAMTESGIDSNLGFRQLTILRASPAPTGKKTLEFIQSAKTKGTVFLEITDEMIRTLYAMDQLSKLPPIGFERWLKERQVLSRLTLYSRIADAVALRNSMELKGEPQPEQSESQDAKIHPTQVTMDIEPASLTDTLNLGCELKEWVQSGLEKVPTLATHTTPSELENHQDDPTTQKERYAATKNGDSQNRDIIIGSYQNGAKLEARLSAETLKSHSFIVAGSGAGKTVLMKSILESAALSGISSIVFDIGNDLAALGDRPPTASNNSLTSEYFRKVDVVVWTPGNNTGNPLHIDLLPDFSAFKDSPDELKNAVNFARDTIASFIVKGKGKSATLERSLLGYALESFSTFGRNDLHQFITYLSDLPPEATGNIKGYEKIAEGLANLLRAELQINPVIQPTNQPTCPSTLFGTNKEKPRISVINLNSLGNLQSQMTFVQCFLTTIYAWIKRNPREMHGIIAIDEAKEFVPSTGSTTTKEIIKRFAQQSRKYGVGMLFATQTPKGIDHEVVANCRTQFLGIAQSPTAIQAVKELIRIRNGNPTNLGSLQRGQFYFSTENALVPQIIQVPMCISHHPKIQLNQDEIDERAKSNRP